MFKLNKLFSSGFKQCLSWILIIHSFASNSFAYCVNFSDGDMFGFEPGIEEDSSTNAFQTLLDNVNSYHLDKRFNASHFVTAVASYIVNDTSPDNDFFHISTFLTSPLSLNVILLDFKWISHI